MSVDLLPFVLFLVLSGVLGFYVGGKIALREEAKNLEELKKRKKSSKKSKK